MTSPIIINIPGAKLLSSRGSGANGRQHWGVRAREIMQHRQGANGQVAGAILLHTNGRYALKARWQYNGQFRCLAAENSSGRPFSASSITLSRICPRRYFCDGADNLRALFKATLDGVADALGVNDKVFVDNPTESDIQSGKISISYEQIDGPWGVRITIVPAT